MRRGWAIGATLLVVLLTVGIAVGAYNAGSTKGSAARPTRVR